LIGSDGRVSFVASHGWYKVLENYVCRNFFAQAKFDGELKNTLKKLAHFFGISTEVISAHFPLSSLLTVLLITGIGCNRLEM